MGGLVDYYAAYFSSKETIHISLDTVLFADGSVAGPNTSHWVERWRASLEAERHVCQAIPEPLSSRVLSLFQASRNTVHLTILIRLATSRRRVRWGARGRNG